VSKKRTCGPGLAHVRKKRTGGHVRDGCITNLSSVFLPSPCPKIKLKFNQGNCGAKSNPKSLQSPTPLVICDSISISVLCLSPPVAAAAATECQRPGDLARVSLVSISPAPPDAAPGGPSAVQAGRQRAPLCPSPRPRRRCSAGAAPPPAAIVLHIHRLRPQAARAAPKGRRRLPLPARSAHPRPSCRRRFCRRRGLANAPGTWIDRLCQPLYYIILYITVPCIWGVICQRYHVYVRATFPYYFTTSMHKREIMLSFISKRL
jgi:hypothetical protein